MWSQQLRGLKLPSSCSHYTAAPARTLSYALSGLPVKHRALPLLQSSQFASRSDAEKAKLKKQKEKELARKQKEKERLLREKEKERERLAKERERERLQREKEKERERALKEKEKEMKLREKEKERAEREKLKAKQQKEKEKEKEKARKEKERQKALQEKEKEKLRLQKEREKAKKLKEKEKLRAEKEKERLRKEQEDAKPKRVLSPFSFFVKEKYSSIAQQYPNEKGVEITKRLAEQWKNLSDSERKHFEELTEKDKQRKAAEMEQYLKSLGPKRPLSAYMFFIKEKRDDVVKKNPNASVTEIAKILGQQWKAMGDGEKQVPFGSFVANLKQPYKAKAEKAKREYEELKRAHVE